MLKDLLDDDTRPAPEPEAAKSARTGDPTVISLFDSVEDPGPPSNDPYILSSAPAESLAETARRSGLAWSLGIAFFSAVVFMLILGWGADLLFGTSPWGVVVGIIVGSVIGFFQLFRLSSQILNK